MAPPLPLASQVVSTQISNVKFSFYSPEEIKKLSVKRITSSVVLDALGQPCPGGLYDPAMGPIDRFARCGTCSLNSGDCPGHMGHIELVSPVFNPMLFLDMFKTLQVMCLNCHHLRMSVERANTYAAILKLVDCGMVSEALELLDLGYIAPRAENPKGKSKKDASGEGEEGVNDEALDASIHEGKIRRYTELMSQAEMSFKEGAALLLSDGGTVHSQAIRKHVIHEMLSKCRLKKCDNCTAFCHNYRKDGYTKVFRAPLQKNHQRSNDRAGKGVRAVLDDGVDHVRESEMDMDNAEKKRKDKRKKKGPSGEYISDSEDDESDAELDEDAQKEAIDRAADAEEDGAEVTGTVYMSSLEIQGHFRRLWAKQASVLDMIWGTLECDPKSGLVVRSSSHNKYFLTVLAVPPNRFRPPNVIGDQTLDSPQNMFYSKILQTSVDLAELTAAGKDDSSEAMGTAEVMKKMLSKLIEMQQHVNALIDNTKTGQRPGDNAGIRQGLEKKEGLFRKNMMGKRVNFAARSVISPDPYIATNEIGIPLRFARRLTYPQPVTKHNVRLMRKLVENGPLVYPGANAIENENGHVIDLTKRTYDQRVALAKTLLTEDSGTNVNTIGRNKKVYRHLQTGDVLLVNRQPTLHKPGIMAHKARVLQNQKTIRMHYANCNTYNADFDGDEMNLHFPQDEISRAEAYTIALTDHQYLVPTNGGPLRGLIQDHVGAGVMLTKRDTMLTKEQYVQLVYAAMCETNSVCERITLVQPCIFKPRKLWSGKQVVTTVLNHLTRNAQKLNLGSKARVPKSAWGLAGAPPAGVKSVGLEDDDVIISENVLCMGVLDKNQFGASGYGLVHAFHELYGPTAAGSLLTILGRLFTYYFQTHGFTCGIDDMILRPQAEAARADLVKQSRTEGVNAAASFVGLEKEDEMVLINEALQSKLREKPENSELLDRAMKGAMNKVTTKIIDVCLPHGAVKPFPVNNLGLMTTSGAKGSKVNFSQISCLLGQQELEGKRVPIMPNGKSLPCFRAFDPSPRAGGYIANRFLTGITPQEYYFHCMAGREGLVDTAVKTSRSGYLQRCLVKHLEGLRVQYDYTVRDADGSLVQFNYGEDSLDVTKVKWLEKFPFLASNYTQLIQNFNPTDAANALDSKTAVAYGRKALKKPHKYDPTLSKYEPGSYFGAVSEKVTKRINEFAGSAELASINEKITPNKFEGLVWLKYLHSLIQPGESVGVLAAQSLGEPSTQMTLNTFHLAGHGGANVTLGIPRLREIIMTASDTIKTPLMTIPLLPKDVRPAAFADDRATAEHVQSQLKRLTLPDVIEGFTVTETIDDKVSGAARRRQYNIKVNFRPFDLFKKKYSVDFRSISTTMEQKFIPAVIRAIKKELKMKTAGVSRSAKKEEEEGDRNVYAPAAEDEDNGADEAAALAAAARKKGALVDSDDESMANMEEEGVIEQRNKERKSENAFYEEDDVKLDDDDDSSSSSDSADSDTPLNVLAEKTKPRGKDSHITHGKAQDFVDSVVYNSKTETCTFDARLSVAHKRLLMVSILEAVAETVVIKAVYGINDVHVVKSDGNSEWAVQTEGLNFGEVWKRSDLVDVNNINTNDIGAVLRTYGVEAAARSIREQVMEVFKPYGISVDPRHLSLVADYMTFEGGYRPLNRMGIDTNPSPFLKMTFETSTNFLMRATMHGDIEALNNPSARLVMGQVPYTGTGAFDLVQPFE